MLLISVLAHKPVDIYQFPSIITYYHLHITMSCLTGIVCITDIIYNARRKMYIRIPGRLCIIHTVCRLMQKQSAF